MHCNVLHRANPRIYQRLRDVTNEQEAELNQKIKELEEENYELSEIKGRSSEA